MVRHPLIVLLFPLTVLAACSDYELNGKPDEGGFDTGETGFDPGIDSGEETATDSDTDPRACADRTYAGGTIRQNEECYQAGPTVGSFTPILEWKIETFVNTPASTQVMMMPAVAPLIDTNGDGRADEDDVPAIVFITYSGSGSTPYVLRAVRGDGSAEIFGISDATLQGQGGVALGDIDGDGWTDIVAATTTGVKAFDHNGAVMWTSSSLSGHIYGVSDNPAISDMDGDGHPEIIMGNAILDWRGRTLGLGTKGMAGVNYQNVGTASVAVDIDGDGVQEVVTGNALYHLDGSIVASNASTDGYVAVGNFDGDDRGEIVVTSGGTIRLQDDDMRVLCQASIPGAGSSYYGGPPTIADFDGDGEAEFAAASGSRYSVFEKDCSVSWQAVTQDASSGNTGSAVFDFEGDGVAEAVYADETTLWAFNGPDGAVKLSSNQHSNATWLEYPPIVDADGDGQAEIIVANTIYTSAHSGIYVFGDADSSWMPGRKIWNQHAYHITNINPDGTIPTTAERNWLSYNNFRSGDLTPGEGYSGPDLVTTVEGVCIDECDSSRLYVWVSVGNAGFQDVETDVDLQLIGVLDDSSEVVLGAAIVTNTMRAATSQDAVEFIVDPVPANLVSLYAAIDGGNNATSGVVEECIEDDNEGEYHENLCP